MSAPVTASAGLPRGVRLLRPAEFKLAFARGKRAQQAPFAIAFLARPGQSGPRLGLAIAKRNARRAIERNRVKRQIREDFRKRARHLPVLDCVIYLGSGSADCSNAALRAALDGLWRKVSRTCESSCSS